MSFRVKLSLFGFALAFTCFILFGRNFFPLEGSVPDNSISKTWFKSGSYEVDLYQEIMVDQSRTTSVNGDYAGSAQRTLEVHVWAPKSVKNKFPLIIYSHGFVSTWRGGAYLAEHLASRGYVVAAPNFPLTNWYAPGGPNITDIVNQPGDVSFIIDTILKQSSSEHHRLFELIDSKNIGVVGLSLGGLTSTLLGFHPKWRDERVGAVLSIAGPTAMFRDDFFQHNKIPFLMLAGDIDVIVPYQTNAKRIPEKVHGSELVTVRSASHTGFSGMAKLLGWLDNPDRVGCFFVNRNLLDDDQDSLRSVFSSSGVPIDEKYKVEICAEDKFPKAMDLRLQRTISTLVVTSFFERQFSDDLEVRVNARDFLKSDLAREFDSVTVVSHNMRKSNVEIQEML